MRHVATAAMIDLVEQKVSKSERERCQQHLTDCERCTPEYESWWTFLSGLGPSNLTDAPSELLNGCIAIYRKPEQQLSGFQKACVLFDSFLQPLAVTGLRGTMTEARQVVVGTDDFDVHLKVSGKEFNQTVMAQLLPKGYIDVADAEIQLRVPGHAALLTRSNEFGQFTLKGVPSGPFFFLIALPPSGNKVQFSV